jgi:hypothetical protein
VHEHNKPAARRDAILAALQTLSLDVHVDEVSPAPPTADGTHSLALGRTIHDDGYVSFLETAWVRWEAQLLKVGAVCINFSNR